MARRRIVVLPALVATAVAVACLAALVAGSQKAEATFPGQNGKIAYASYDGTDYEVYTISPGGGGKSRVTNNDTPDYGLAWGSR